MASECDKTPSEIASALGASEAGLLWELQLARYEELGGVLEVDRELLTRES